MTACTESISSTGRIGPKTSSFMIGDVPADVDQDGRGDVQVVEVELAADDGGAAVEQSGEAFGALAVDDAAVVGARLGVVAVEVLDRLDEVLDELVLDLGPHEDVVGRGADLPGVGVAAVGDAPGGGLDVGRRVDDGRALAPELEHGGGEVLGGGLVDDLADAAGCR